MINLPSAAAAYQFRPVGAIGTNSTSREIPTLFNRLDETVTKLGATVERLESRLGPILPREELQAVSPQAKSNDYPTPISHMANQLIEIDSRCDALVARLSRLEDRVQL